ncbi:MAG: GyrI-like domain-containing protein [Kofleriaceae bacterium]|nr:GyrI-like domain-containing protein [Kofleriaceae bacterium]
MLTLTAQPALLRTVRAAPADLGDALTGAIFGLIAATSSSGAEPAGPPFARYLSRGDAADPTMVVEAGLPVVAPPTGALPDDVVAGELPAGEAVALVFVGPHERLGEAHAALDGWLAAHRRDAAGPRWEVFLTNPVTTPDPEQQRTKVFVPLREVAP